MFQLCYPPPWRATLLVAAVLLPPLAGCKKDPIDTLPAATQTGANTMGCLIDGKAWTPGGASTASGKPYQFTVEYYPHNPPQATRLLGRFALTAYRKSDGKGEAVLLALDSLLAPGTYHFHQRTAPYPAQTPYPNHAAFSTSQPARASYVTDADHTGSITITRLDTTAHVISGTFAFTAGPYAGTTTTVRVTDGRFDVIY